MSLHFSTTWLEYIMLEHACRLGLLLTVVHIMQSIEDITRIVREAQQNLDGAAWGDDDYIDEAMENEDLENEAYGSSLDDWGMAPGGST